MRLKAFAPRGLTPADRSVFEHVKLYRNCTGTFARCGEKICSIAEKGSDSVYKTIFAILAIKIYDRGLTGSQKPIVDEMQAKGVV